MNEYKFLNYEKENKKKILFTATMVTLGGVILYVLLKRQKRMSSNVYSLAQIQKHIDKITQRALVSGMDEAELANEYIDKLFYSAEKIISKYPSNNVYIKTIKQTFGIY